MNQALLWRMIWKEYRTYRGFWIAMMILAIGLQVLLAYARRLSNNQPVEPEDVVGLALGMCVFYALGIGATIFNVEQEQDTWNQLRAWPSSFRIPWLGKLLFALMSFVALEMVLSLTTRWIWGVFDWWICWIAGGVGVVVLTIAVVCSELIRRPLLSIFAAGGVASVVFSFGNYFHHSSRDPRVGECLAAIFFVGVGLLAVGTSYPLANRWFADRGRLAHNWRLRDRLGPGAWITGRSQLTRIAWLSLRQLGWIWLGMLLLVGLVFLAAQEADFTALLFFWPPVIGATLFSGDQSNRSYQFLSERGVSARQLWWQRQAIGLIVFFALLSLSATPVVRVWAESTTHGNTFPAVTSYLAYCLLAYAWGQMSSVVLRSLLLSVAVALVGAVPWAAWSGLAGWFRLPLWLAVALPAVGLWTASRVRASKWIVDRDRARDWIVPIAVLMVALTAVGVGFYLHRVYEIPWVEPQANTSQHARQQPFAHEQAVSRIERVLDEFAAHRAPIEETDQPYVSVAQMKAEGITPPPWNDLPRPISAKESEWVRDTAELLDDSTLQSLETVATLHRSGRRQTDDYQTSVHVRELASLLVAQARQRQFAGDLDGALTRYKSAMRACEILRPQGDSFAWWMANHGEFVILHNLLFWAADKNQTGAQLQQAIDWSRTWLGKEASWTTPVIADAQLQRDIIRDLPSPFGRSGDVLDVYILSYPIDPISIWAATIPGERPRWQRLSNLLEQANADVIEQYVRDVQRHQSIEQLFAGGDANHSSWFDRGDRRRHDHWKQLEAWLSSTPLFPRFAGSMWSTREILVNQVLLENQRRATHLSLRLIQWRFEHGSYPTSLQQLQVEPDESLPPDVLTGRSFEYVPEGLETNAVRYFSPSGPLGPSWVDASGVPVVASPKAMLEDLSRYAGYEPTIRACVYPLPPAGVILRHASRTD